MTLAALFGDRQNDFYTYGKCSAMIHISQKQFHEFALSWPSLTFLGPESRKEFQKYANVTKFEIQVTYRRQIRINVIRWFYDFEPRTFTIFAWYLPWWCMMITLLYIQGKNLHSDIPQQGPIEKDDISTIGSGVFRCIYASSQSPPVPFVDSATCVPWFGVSDWVGGGGGGCGDFWEAKNNVEKGDVEVLDIWLIWLYQQNV